MSSSEAAAWFQAVGSLLGIGAAIVAPLLVDHLRRKRAKEAGKRKARTIAVAIYAEVRNLQRMASNFYHQYDNDHAQEQPFDYTELDGEFTRVAPQLRAALLTVDGSEELAELLRSLTIDVSKAENWMANINDMMQAGHHAAFQNNLNELREIANRISGSARNLGDAIENLFPDDV